MQTLKHLAKGLLRRFERKLVYVPRGQVWGSDLREDLQAIVGDREPLCLDVGANKGQTIDFLQDTFSSPRIHAFEPLPGAYAFLVAKVHSDTVTLHNMALGSVIAELPFYEYESNDLSSLLPLSHSKESRFAGAVPTNVLSVPVTTVDEFLETHGIEGVDILKSDTQGYDLQVLMGAKNALRSGRIDLVLIELNLIEIYEGQCAVSEIFDFMHESGFGLVDLYDKERSGHKIQWCNALFLRNDL